MIERFKLYASALRFRSESHTPTPEMAIALADAARQYGPYYRSDFKIDIEEAHSRRSRGMNERDPLSLSDLCELLWLTMFSSDDASRRPYPAAGAVYCSHLYVVVKSIIGLRSGIYYLRWVDRELERIADLDDQFMKDCIYQKNIDGISCLILVVADIRLSKMKYHDRAVRFALLEAGALMQTVYLAAEKLRFAVSALGGVGDAAALKVCQLEQSEDLFLATSLSVTGRLQVLGRQDDTETGVSPTR